MKELRKIVRVEEPHKNNRNFHGGLYRVWFEGQDMPTDMFEAEYKLVKFEDELVRREHIDTKLLIEYKELIKDCIEDQGALEGESI